MATRFGPTRRAAGGTTSPLPTLDALAPDDVVYLRMMLGLAETGSMFQGRYVEAHVARVIGAQLPTTGTSPWDLYLPGPPDLRIEVKSTARGGTFTAAALEKDADLWIFVTYEHNEKTRRPYGLRYSMGNRAEVKRAFRRRNAVSAVALMERLGLLPNAKALRVAIGSHSAR